MRRWLRCIHQGEPRCATLAEDGQTILLYDGPRIGMGTSTGERLGLDEVALTTPTDPSKFIGLWNNFGELAAKQNWARPAVPLYFLKAPSSTLRPGGTIRIPPGYEGKIFYEGELGIVIGSPCTAVAVADAPLHILGYTCVNDVTAFDLLHADASFAQWARAKSCDTFAPFGPVVAEGLDWSSLSIQTWVNGRERQNYRAADMILSPAEIVSLVSREMTLVAGDVIACGTSIGSLPMKPGSVVEIVIEGIGRLSNTLENRKAQV